MFERIWNWIKDWIIDNKPIEKNFDRVPVTFVLPSGKPLTLENFYNSCKKHPEYTGKNIPTNNCNDCWEFHSKVHKSWL